MMKYRAKNIIITTVLSLILSISFFSSIPATLRTDPISIGGDVYDGGGGGPLTPGAPYLITCDIRVPPGRTLTVQPSAQLFFEYGFDITAYGDLNIHGASDIPTCLLSSADNYGLVVYGGELRMQNGGSIKIALSENKYPLDGTFMAYRRIDDYHAYFDELEEIGMNTVIIGYIKIQSDCNGSDFSWWMEDYLDNLTKIFDEADNRGFDIYVGLVKCDCDWPYEHVNPNAAIAIEETRVTAAYINNLYEDRASFKGWYLPPEPGACGPEYIPYIAGLVSAIRESSNKPILIAPYFGGVYEHGYSPEFVADRANEFMDETDVDIFVWQDSAGTAIDIGWNNHPWTLEAYYEAISNAIGRDSLWSDNELFNWCPDHQNPGGGVFRPTTVARLYHQLQMTKYSHVSKRIVWTYDAYMGSIFNHPEAPRLLAAYKAFYGIDGNYNTPLSYSWTTTPDESYLDSDNEMFNKMTGDPKYYLDEDWTGIFGDAELVIDLGTIHDVNWVAGHLLNNEELAILFPDQIIIYSSNNGQDWVHEGAWDRPSNVNEEDSTYVFSNLDQLDMTCRYIKVRFENSVWTFISEIEIISDTAQ